MMRGSGPFKDEHKTVLQIFCFSLIFGYVLDPYSAGVCVCVHVCVVASACMQCMDGWMDTRTQLENILSAVLLAF